MRTPRPSDPSTDKLLFALRANALLLVMNAESRLRPTGRITPQQIQAVIAACLIPAEAMVRRLVLILAAGLSATLWRRPLARPATGCPAPRAAAPVAAKPRRLAFRFAEVQVRSRTGDRAASAVRGRTEPKSAAEPQSADQLLDHTRRRFAAVLHVIANIDAEAIRFRRRYVSPQHPDRPPLVWVRTRGIKPAPFDAFMRDFLATADTAAATAWQRLCDSS